MDKEQQATAQQLPFQQQIKVGWDLKEKAALGNNQTEETTRRAKKEVKERKEKRLKHEDALARFEEEKRIKVCLASTFPPFFLKEKHLSH